VTEQQIASKLAAVRKLADDLESPDTPAKIRYSWASFAARLLEEIQDEMARRIGKKPKQKGGGQ
jgi:hypothetical protein